MTFADRLVDAVRRTGTPLCLGLDPVLERIPEAIVKTAVERAGAGREGAAVALAEFCGRLLDALAGKVPAVKVQAACFELYGAPGVAAFENVVRAARDRGYLVVGDLKRGDIGVSAQHYARGWLGAEMCDAITVNAYLGEDGIKPFVDVCREHDAGIFVLVATSNPGAEAVQHIGPEGGRVVDVLAREVDRWGAEVRGDSGYSSVGAVVGATRPRDAATLRSVMPHAFFLVPGLGAQGAKPEDLKPFFNADGLGALVNVSRSLIYAHEDRKQMKFEDAVRAEAKNLIAQLKRVTGGAR
jgi:orotidine-5'-phosphate decarboxylase